MSIHVEVRGVRMAFGEFVALESLDLRVEPGEFLSILGPSGCGKTTLLNVIAGFLAPTAGAVYIGGDDVTHLPPDRRNLGMVFQSYALFPHMTVAENVAYGLIIRRTPRAAVEQRVTEALEMVKLSGLGSRRPRELSGGQQQRVAIARALAVQPRVLLLDEPLSNLDAKLRREMRVELKQLQSRVGVTTVFVTHDQEEALTMSDRIVVMNRGCIEQIGHPTELYRTPATRFVAEFIGNANLFTGDVTGPVQRGQEVAITTGGGGIIRAVAAASIPAGKVSAVVRPERVGISRQRASTANCFAGTVEYAVFVGSGWQYGVRLESGQQLSGIVADDPDGLPRAGEQVWACFSPAEVVVIPEAGGVRV